ncbi:DUF6629 family protein [Chlamydiota bacterium]
MCYSASASFTAAAALAVVGVILLFRMKNKHFLPLALVPLFFAIQQSAEGVLWLDYAQNAFEKNLFLFFALVFWPLWSPFSFWFAEEKSGRKQALALCFGIGLVVSCLLAFAVPSMTAAVRQYSIQYTYPPDFNLQGALSVFYVAATVVPFFLSSLPKTTLFGLLFALSALLIGWIDKTFFISIWCFVAAVISLGLFFIVKPSFKV